MDKVQDMTERQNSFKRYRTKPLATTFLPCRGRFSSRYVCYPQRPVTFVRFISTVFAQVSRVAPFSGVTNTLCFLCRRGLVRTDYTGATLRDHLGLARPLNRRTPSATQTQAVPQAGLPPQAGSHRAPTSHADSPTESPARESAAIPVG